MVRPIAYVLALIGQITLWVSPLFACACGANCVERRGAASAVQLDGCSVEAVRAESAGCCCCLNGNEASTSNESRPWADSEKCPGDRLGKTPGTCSGEAEDGSCGCFHGPAFEIAAQNGVQPRLFGPAQLPAFFFTEAASAAELSAGVPAGAADFCGLAPSSTRIQAVLCVWRK